MTVEDGISAETRQGLRGLGHVVEGTRRFDGSMGHAQMILRDPRPDCYAAAPIPGQMAPHLGSSETNRLGQTWQVWG